MMPPGVRGVGAGRAATAAWTANAVTYGGYAAYTVCWLNDALAAQPAAG